MVRVEYDWNNSVELFYEHMINDMFVSWSTLVPWGLKEVHHETARHSFMDWLKLSHMVYSWIGVEVTYGMWLISFILKFHPRAKNWSSIFIAWKLIFHISWENHVNSVLQRNLWKVFCCCSEYFNFTFLVCFLESSSFTNFHIHIYIYIKFSV